jgi:ribosome recycling factor
MNTTELQRKLNDSLEFLKGELAQIRTGRVTPGLLDSVIVNAYGSNLTVREVGTINVLDPQTLQVTPWDKNLLEAISNGIKNSDLNLNPSIRNDSVIIPIPTLTEERRKEFTRTVSVKMEEVKNSMRSVRQDAMKEIDTAFEKKEFGEDEKFTMKDEVEDMVKEFVAKAEELGEQKKDDILGK